MSEAELKEVSIIEERLSNKKSILQFIPSNLEEIILNKEIIIFTNKRLKTTYLVDIVHNLLLKYFSTLKHGVGETSFNLSSIILREKYGNDYSHYLKFLIDKKVLVLTSDYLVGKKTKTYTLSGETLKSEFHRYRNFDKVILSRYIKNVLSIRLEKTNKSWIEPNIKLKLVEDLFSVTIDLEKSKSMIEGLVNDKDVYNKNLYSIQCIEDGHIFYNFDDYGRMHSNFTVLKSSIRKECLLIDSKHIGELDIKNSQPMFLTILISKNLDKIKDIEEFNFFKRSVIEGTIYKYFMDECSLETKKEVKEMIYKVLFGRNRSDAENRLFKKLFPSIYSFIKLYKRDCGDYRALAYYLQRSESNLLFNNIIKKIMIVYPEIKLFTIHDSICFNVEYRKQIEEIFYNEINNLFND